MTIPTGNAASRAKANTTRRQKLKSKWDKKCKYEANEVSQLPNQFHIDGSLFATAQNNNSEENWCRLLDEGIVVDNNFWTGEPEVYAVIRKGTIKKWYDNLPDNFVGTIDKDHNRSIDLGKFTKEDLKLVELENGRYAVDVNVKLDHELYAVKDLLRMNNRTALSVEMFVNADEFATAKAVTGGQVDDTYLVPLIDTLKIEGYAVCIAPKSANSYKDDLLEKAGANDIKLTGDFNMGKQVGIATTEEELTTTVNEAQVDSAAVVENTEAPAEETTETEEVEEKVEEEVKETETEAETESEEEGEETENADGKEDKLSAIEKEITNLKAENASLKEENESLKTKLVANEEKASATEERLTSILAMASTETPTADEGGKATPEEQKIKDEELDIYKSAFSELNKEQ